MQELFRNLIGLIIFDVNVTLQEICLRCFVVTSLPTTSPFDLISNSSLNGISKTPELETSRLEPAPYKGTLVAIKFTIAVL